MELAELRYRNTHPFNPYVGAIRFDPHDEYGKTHWHVIVATRPDRVYWREWATKPMKQAILNDFYRDQDFWVKSSRGIPSICEELLPEPPVDHQPHLCAWCRS